jgi:fucose 4-O-acetylase-like acetyltransferase
VQTKCSGCSGKAGYFATLFDDEARRFMAQFDRRNIRIDTLRGLACLLLVLYHVVGSNSTSGLQLHPSHGMVLLNEVLGYLRMPLFSILSGYVYARRPFRQDAGAFIVGKARRLLVPMLVVGTTFALLQAAVPGSNSQVADWHLLHVVPVAHYWFLESLFVIFMTILALEHINALATRLRFAVVMAGAALMFVTEPFPVYFGLAGAAYLFPFVLFGLWCGRLTGTAKGEHRVSLQMGVVLVVVAILHAGLVAQALPGKYSLTALILGCGCGLILLNSRLESSALASVGRHSFAIFLLHTMGTAASRIVLTKVGLASIYVLVPVGMWAGIALPVMASSWLKNVPWWTQWVLGESAPKSKSRSAPLSAPAEPGGVVGSAFIPDLSVQHKRMQRRLRRVRERMAQVEIVQSVQSKQGNDTAF